MGDKKQNPVGTKAIKARLERRAGNELQRQLPTEKCHICGQEHTVHRTTGGD